MTASRLVLTAILILPAASDCAPPQMWRTSDVAASTSPKPERQPPDAWMSASKVLHRHLEPEIKVLRTVSDRWGYGDNPRIVRADAPLLDKYLPKFRLYVLDTNIGGGDRLFFLDQDGHIYPVGDGNWQWPRGVQELDQRLIGFIRERGIHIADTASAVEFSRLIETIYKAPGYMTQHRAPVEPFSAPVPDFHLSVQDYFMSDWEHIGSSAPNGWRVEVNYAGSGSIPEPPTYRIVVGEGGIFLDIYCTDRGASWPSS